VVYDPRQELGSYAEASDDVAARIGKLHFLSWCGESGLARKTGDSSEALIVSSAAKIGAIRILSEDLNAGQRIAGILLENPFVGIP
jgi:hypothetical protein